MLRVSSGYSPEYLTKEVAAGRENYYTGAVLSGEPAGRWYGTGAEALGLTGLVDHQDMTALYERFIDPRDERFRDPQQWDAADTLGHTGREYRSEDELYAEALEREPNASAERRAELWLDAGKRAKKNVAFFDATFSVQKSITVLHTAFEAKEMNARTAGDTETEAAWARHREAVEAAIWAGNRAGLDYLTEHAGFSRVGHHGGAAGRYIDAHDWTIASFFQHDSRDQDPQLHVHNAILNRVQCADGQWRTLDGRGLYAHRGAASAVADRVTEEHLAAALGVQFATRPDGKSREVVGISDEVMGLFSSRRRAVTKHTAELVEAFEAKFGRAPNGLELSRLSQQATLATRKAKSHEGETREQMLERWNTQLRHEIHTGLEQVADDVLGLQQQGPQVGEFSPAAVLETALADVQAKKSAWTAPDLTRAISDALPDHLGTHTPEQVTRLLDSLTAQGLELAVPLDAKRPGSDELPDELRLANGNAAYDAPGRRVYATPEHVHTERVLVANATERDAAALDERAAAGFFDRLGEEGIELGADQAAAVRGVLTSGARIDSLVGPAGTGKSFTVGALTRAWTDADLWGGGRPKRVFGLASSQIATETLAGEGVQARNITRWLNTQQHLDEGKASADERDQWTLRGGDLVVVDESAMTTTDDLASIHAHARKAGAKLLLVGDQRQLAAVGAGGGMELLADHGGSFELAEARRFNHEWERAASLRLRAGDETVLDTYHRHGRIVDGGAHEQTEAAGMRAYLADTLNGKRSLLLVDSNEQAARLSAQVRAELVRLGKVEETGAMLAEGTFAGAGDLVQARQNEWSLAGVEGNQRGPINRENYRVLEAREDGSLVVTPDTADQHGRRIVLPANYVAEHLALGYASTAHSSQGLTVDTCHGIITNLTDLQALYVALSRGRECNTAHTVTRHASEEAEIGETGQAVHRSPAAVLAGILETGDSAKSALATATESAQDNESIRTPTELLADATELATTGRTNTWLDQLTADGVLTERERTRLAAEDGAASLSRLLRRAELAGHNPRDVLETAISDRSLEGSRQLTNVLHNRITNSWNLDPTSTSHTERVPAVEDPDWQQYLHSLATAADNRAADLGEQAAKDQPQWAIEAFGPVPQDELEHDTWTGKAGLVAAHRELVGHTDEAEPLGPAPKPGQTEAYASWRTAWRALGRPEANRDELELSDGQLRVRVRAAEREAAWAPRYVGNELAGTRQAADAQRRTSTLKEAEAEAASDESERDALRQQAAEAAALADTLERQVGALQQVEQARGKWLAHTAATRAAAERATAELTARHADLERGEDDTVTAEEWLAAHEEHVVAEDQHRPITETDLDPEEATADEPQNDTDAELDQSRPEHQGAPEKEPEPAREEPEAEPEPVAENAPQDIREEASNEPAQQHEDELRVPSQDETTESVARAQRALAEIRARAADDAQQEQEAREQQVTRWHETDRAAETEAAASEQEPELA